MSKSIRDMKGKYTTAARIIAYEGFHALESIVQKAFDDGYSQDEIFSLLTWEVVHLLCSTTKSNSIKKDEEI